MLLTALDECTDISELTCRTKPGKFYIPPKPSDVKTVLAINKFTPQNFDILADVVNLVSDGGTYTPITNDTEDANSYGRIMRSRGRLALNENTDQNSFVKERISYHNNVRRFLGELDEQLGFQQVIGYSPLQKSMTVLRLLSAATGNKSSGNGKDLFSGLASTNFQSTQVAQQVTNAINAAKSLSIDEKSLLGYEPEDGSKDRGGGEDHPDLRAVDIALDMLNGKNLLLKVARTLSTLSRMSIGRSIERIVDPAGRILDPRCIESFDNMSKLSTTEWTYSKLYRNYRIATHQARIYERAIERAKKQCIYMLVDCSGSMGGNRAWMAGGCVMRGLKGVIEEDAEMYLRFFDTDVHEEYSAKTPKESHALMKKVVNGSFSGGGTQIARCTLKTLESVRRLTKENSLVKPELVLVTDGEDDCNSLHYDHFGNIKLHVICVAPGSNSHQTHLRKVAMQTGGVGIVLESKNL